MLDVGAAPDVPSPRLFDPFQPRPPYLFQGYPFANG